jgi:hypothetical protein
MNMYRVMKVQLHALLTSTLDRGDWLVSCPICFTRRERAPVPTLGLDTVESVALAEFINVAWWSLYDFDFIIRTADHFHPVFI